MIFDFEPGDKVFNPKNRDWGIGQIQSIINDKITVNFQNAGKKVINTKNIELKNKWWKLIFKILLKIWLIPFLPLEKFLELREKGLIKHIKPDNTPVSNGDLEVNKIIIDELTKLTPRIPIISEETPIISL